jgi:hypothetical protein
MDANSSGPLNSYRFCSSSTTAEPQVMGSVIVSCAGYETAHKTESPTHYRTRLA